MYDLSSLKHSPIHGSQCFQGLVSPQPGSNKSLYFKVALINCLTAVGSWGLSTMLLCMLMLVSVASSDEVTGSQTFQCPWTTWCSHSINKHTRGNWTFVKPGDQCCLFLPVSFPKVCPARIPWVISPGSCTPAESSLDSRTLSVPVRLPSEGSE